MGYKKATHEQTKLNKLIDRQQNGGSQRGRGWERMKKVPGVKYTAMGGDWMSGEYTQSTETSCYEVGHLKFT